MRNGNDCGCRASGWQGGVGAFTGLWHIHVCAAHLSTAPSVHVCVNRSSRRSR